MHRSWRSVFRDRDGKLERDGGDGPKLSQSDGGPLLPVAVEKDHRVPASMNRANSRKDLRLSAITDFREFPGSIASIIAQEGGPVVASYIAEWISTRTRRQSVAIAAGASMIA